MNVSLFLYTRNNWTNLDTEDAWEHLKDTYTSKELEVLVKKSLLHSDPIVAIVKELEPLVSSNNIDWTQIAKVLIQDYFENNIK